MPRKEEFFRQYLKFRILGLQQSKEQLLGLGSVAQEIQGIPALAQGQAAISAHSCGPGWRNRRRNELEAAKK